MDKVIFIIGVGRSGTSLLQSMLNSHKDIAFTPESHFVKNYLSRYGNLSIKKSKDIVKFIQDDKNIKRASLDIDKLVEQNLINKRIDILGFYKSFLSKYIEKKGKTIVGDKDPKNIENLKVIKKYFPDAYVLHIIRDPRDVVLSRLKAKWSKNRGVFIHALTYEEQIKKGQNDGRKYFGDNYYEVKYEDLIIRPEETLKRITQLLGIEYDGNMLNYMKNASEVVKEDERAWKENCFRPILQKNYNKWCNTMNDWDIYTIQKICKGSMVKNRYEFKKTKLVGLLVNIKILLFSSLFSIAYKVHMIDFRRYRM